MRSTDTLPSTGGHLRQALGLARLEQLHDARQAVRDVRAGDAAGVERPHGQLRARLADRLGGDDAHRVADLRRGARGHGPAVAGLAHAGRRLALQHRAHGHVTASSPSSSVEVGLAQLLEVVAVDLRPLARRSCGRAWS